VTGQDGWDEQEARERWTELGIRVDIPHPARVYDYMLGGKDHFAADREMAEVGLRHMPEMRVSSRENRAFLVRAVRFLRDAGIRQFLDIGSGLPTSPITHEVARESGLGARVVYVDNDPVVFRLAQAQMADDEGIAVVPAELRDADDVLEQAGELLDFSQPVGLLLVAVLHNIADAEDPAGIAARYMSALAPGSYVVISHSTRVRPRSDARRVGRRDGARGYLDSPAQGRDRAHVQRPGPCPARTCARLPLATGDGAGPRC
jgi:S-adenosyl methyltransferase